MDLQLVAHRGLERVWRVEGLTDPWKSEVVLRVPEMEMRDPCREEGLMRDTEGCLLQGSTSTEGATGSFLWEL